MAYFKTTTISRLAGTALLITLAVIGGTNIPSSSDPLDTDLVFRAEFEGDGLTDSSTAGNNLDANTGGDLTVAGHNDDDGVLLSGGAAGGAGNSHMHGEPGFIPRACANGCSSAAWIKTANVNQPKYVYAQGISESFVMKYLNTTGTGINFTILCGIKDNTGTPIQVLSAGPHNLIANDTWAHVACVYDRDADTLTGYVNGTAGTPVAVSTSFGSLNNDSATVNNGGSSIGCLPPSQNCTGVQAFSTITVDDLRVWNRAITAAEVTQLAAM